jgi:hypothetical protein
MSITLTRFNWQTGQNDPFSVNDKAVESFVQFMLDSRAWHDDIELVHKKVRTLRRDAQATIDNGMLEPQTMLAAVPIKPRSKPLKHAPLK